MKSSILPERICASRMQTLFLLHIHVAQRSDERCRYPVPGFVVIGCRRSWFIEEFEAL
jgi:hypothetical protein